MVNTFDSEPSVIRLHGVAPESIVDGPGLRYAIFTQGCIHNCPGCHNPSSHDPSGGYDKDIQLLLEEILINPLLAGVTFSGGEPFLQANALCTLGKHLKFHNIPILTFTGYTLENLQFMAKKNPEIAQLLTLSSMLIDGKFKQELRDENLRFCGSTNQRFWRKEDNGWQLIRTP